MEERQRAEVLLTGQAQCSANQYMHMVCTLDLERIEYLLHPAGHVQVCTLASVQPGYGKAALT